MKTTPGGSPRFFQSSLRVAALLFFTLAGTVLPGLRAQSYDANILPLVTTSNGTTATLAVPGAANGNVLAFEGGGESASLTLAIDAPSTGEYSLAVRYYHRPENTNVRLALNGVEQGPLHDGFAASGEFVTVDYGKVLLTGGAQQIKLTATGHHWPATTFGIAIDTITLETAATRTDINSFATIVDALNSGVPLHAPPGTYAIPANFTPTASIDILGSVESANRPVFTVANPSLLPASHSLRFQGIKFVGLSGNNNKLVQINSQLFDMPSYVVLDCSFENCTPVAWATHPSVEGQILRRFEGRRFSVANANRGVYFGGRVDDYDITDFTVADCGRFGVCVGPSGKGIDETIESFMRVGTVARGTISGTIIDTEFNHNQLILSGNNVRVEDMRLLNMVLPPEYYSNSSLATSYPLDSEPFYTKVDRVTANNIYIENDGAYQAMWGHKGAAAYDEFPVSPTGSDAIATNLTFVNTGIRRCVGVWYQTHGTNTYRNITMTNRTNDAVIVREDSASGTLTIENWVDINPPPADDFPGVHNKSRANVPPAPAPVMVTIVNSPTLTEYPSTSVVDADHFDFDANSLTFTATSGDALNTVTLAEGTNGNLRLYNADTAGDFITFQVDVPIAGNYGIDVRFYLGTNRGIYQLAIDGANVGASQDLYGSGLVIAHLGEHALTAGNHQFTFTAVGKNPSSSSYRLGIDLVTLVRLGASTSPAPTGLTAVSPAPTAMNLEWIDNSSTETAFVIERQDSASGTFTQIGTVAPNTTTYTDNGLAAATSYSYRVAAVLASGNSDYSNVATTTTQPPPSTTAILYDANALGIVTSSGESVTNLAQTTGNNGNIRVFNANGVDDFITFRVNVATAGEYRITATYFRNQNRGIYQLAIDGIDVGDPIDHYGTGGLLPIEVGQRALSAGNHQFTFTVVGKNAAAIDYRLGLDTIMLTSVIVPPPSAPTALQAIASASSVDLTWSDPASTAASYTLQRRSGANGIFATIATPAAGVTAFQDTAISPATTYTYRISATNTGGTSAYSNEASATTPAGSGPASTNFDANALTVASSSGESVLSVTNTSASGGDFLRFDSNSAGDFISFAVQIPTTAYYGVEAIFHRNSFRGIAQLKIDAIAHGSPQDLYAASAGLFTASLPDQYLTAGTHTFTFEIIGKNAAATDYQFGLDRLKLTALDLPLPVAPEITQQPADTTTTLGSSVTLSVVATGSPTPTYQWRLDGAEIENATGSSLTIASATFADAGAYDVVISNLTGSVTSSPAQLTVTKAPATVTLGGLTATYDGNPHEVVVQTQPAGLDVVVTYNSSSGAPSAAGSYPVSATINDASYAGATSGTLVIARAPVTIALSGLAQKYDGTPKPIIATTAPAGVNVSITYAGSSTAPIWPGKYAVEVAVIDANYSGLVSAELVIGTTALVLHAPQVNGGLDGSVQVLNGEALTLNGSSWISGDLLVPGTPELKQNGNPVFGGVVSAGGAATPNNYRVTLNGGAVLRHLVNRVDALALPTVPAPTTPTGTRNVTLNSPAADAGDFATIRNLTLNGSGIIRAVPPGSYGSFTVNGNGVLQLGIANASAPALYELTALQLNGQSRVEILGPIVLRLGQSLALNGTFGNADHPEWLELQLASGDVTLNGSAALHGHVVAPAGTVTVNATLRGEVKASRLVINGSGLLEEIP